MSSVRPLVDETLNSFLQRSQAEGGRTDDDFQSLIAGAPLQDAWLAERRDFDWSSLSRFVNATPPELHAMSQRSLLHALDDDGRGLEVRQRAPWLGRPGYGAHCPCCLKESPHWRKSWTRPTALVCRKHNTVMIRDCEQCGVPLDSLIWTQVRPICPSCHHHLTLNPVVAAPEILAHEARLLDQRFDSMLRRAPLSRSDYDLAHFAVVWRAAELLGDHNVGLSAVRAKVLALRGILTSEIGQPTVLRALRHADNVIAAHLLTVMEPALIQHFWHSVTDRESLKAADREVLGKLRDIAENLSVSLGTSAAVPHQLTMSFANWHGSNETPRAA